MAIGSWMTVLLIGVVAISIYVTHRHSISLQTIRERVERLHEATLTLQVAVLQATMPSNNYLIHAHPEERTVFERRVTDVQTRLQQLEALVEGDGSDPRFFKEIRTRFERLITVAHGIFALSNPVGDREAALRMEEIDHLAEQIITDLHRLHAQHTTFLQDKQHIARQAERRMTIITIVGGSGAIIVALLLSMLLSRSLMHPVIDLVAGLRQIAGGDLAHRVPVTTDDEIGTIACEVNAMAEKLEASHGELLVAHQKLHEAYDELIQSDKMASLGLMAGTVAHDIANPLTVILGRVQMLRLEEEFDRQRIEEHYHLIEQQARRIVQEHGGNISVQSEAGKGAWFTVLLPIN
ncbi:MAG: HAMP domain-containing protein [Candidatus Latescibacteria bacterium]|nr:HAMP domain-containing protein [Candidatus Latescibacterota bacterium]